MRQILTVLFLCLSLLLSAKGIKLNIKSQVVSFEIKLEKIEQIDDNIVIAGKIKQRQNFCYSVSFEGCHLVTANGGTFDGTLIQWNEDKKVERVIKPVSDNEAEKFVLSFPAFNLDNCSELDLTIGSVLDRSKTPISIKNIQLKK